MVCHLVVIFQLPNVVFLCPVDDNTSVAGGNASISISGDSVSPSKQASVDNCLINDVLSSNPNSSGRRRHHRRHRRNPGESGSTNESGSNEEDRRRRRATRRAERLRRLNSSPPSTLSNILGMFSFKAIYHRFAIMKCLLIIFIYSLT